MSVPHPAPNPNAEPAHESLPRYTASGRPNTRGERIAFQIWIIMFLLVIVFTLVNYLIGRFI
jgi:hypothetical protein